MHDWEREWEKKLSLLFSFSNKEDHSTIASQQSFSHLFYVFIELVLKLNHWIFNSRALIGLAIMVYEPSYHALQNQFVQKS